MKVFHAFSGVDSQYMAEKRVWGDSVELVGTMEVDPDAIIACALIHHNEQFNKHYSKEWDEEKYSFARGWLKNKNIGFDFEKTKKSKIDRMPKDKLKKLFIASLCNKNYGDISLANQVKIKDDIDLFTYSSPCQSFSVAGKLEGLKGTSGLLLECEKFIEINKPKFLLLENVKNLVGKKFIGDFNNWLSILDNLGYNSYWQVLNAKDFCIPQNRERVFCLSIRKDIDINYKFPKPTTLEKRLKDVLDSNVDSKYYLPDHIVNRFLYKPIGENIIGTTAPDKTIGQRDLVYKPNGIIGTLTATDYKQPKQIAECNRIGGIFNDEQQVYDVKGITRTVKTGSGSGNIPKIIIDENIIPNKHTDKIIKYDIQQQVEVRVHNIDQDDLYNFLKSYKNKSNQQIADELGISKTKVDHWFRNDSSFAIPTKDIWFKLKEVLEIDSDKYDKAITEFEVRDGVYEKSGRIYHSEGIAPTLTTQAEEKIIIPRTDKVIQVGNVVDTGNWDNPQRGRIYSTDGCSPTLNCVGGGGLEPKILIKNATKQGYLEATDGDYINLSYPSSETRRGCVQKDISATLMCNDSNGVIVPKINVVQDYLEDNVDDKFYNIKPSVSENFKREMESIVSTDKDIYQCKCESGFQDNKVGINVSPTLRAGNPVTHILDKSRNFTIRKLTPRECWRLMDFDNDAFDKVKDHISDSQLYKQAGNSIVVACLEHIFRELKKHGVE